MAIENVLGNGVCVIADRRSRSAARESCRYTKLAQAFFAGVEGWISYLKRALRMFRCFNKGWEHQVSTIGATIFTHNLLVLARCDGHAAGTPCNSLDACSPIRALSARLLDEASRTPPTASCATETS